MLRQPHRSGRRAFTLVELLVVIGIIALLIGILLPTLSRARKQAYAVQCESNIRQVVAATLMYSQANRGWMPSVSGGTQGATPAGRGESDILHWQQQGPPPRNLDDSAIVKYLNVKGEKLKTLLRCPLDNYEVRKAPIEAGPYNYSYCLCDRIGRKAWNSPDVQPDAAGRPIKTRMIKNASDKIMIAEEDDPNDTHWGAKLITASTTTADYLTTRHARNQTVGTVNAPAQIWAQTKGGHVGLCDGHVELFSTIEAFDPHHWDPTIP
jgi:prepilin-type N-terminal cleavage/methylation domain-containing protein